MIKGHTQQEGITIANINALNIRVLKYIKQILIHQDTHTHTHTHEHRLIDFNITTVEGTLILHFPQ